MHVDDIKKKNNDIDEEGEMDTGEKEMGCCSSDKCGKIECDDVQLCGGNNNNNNNASSKIAADHHPAKRRKMISKDEENGDNVKMVKRKATKAILSTTRFTTKVMTNKEMALYPKLSLPTESIIRLIMARWNLY